MTYTTPDYTTPTTTNYANWLQRVGAYLIDGIVDGVPILIGYVVLIASVAGGKMSAVGLLLFLVFMLVGLVLSIYNRWVLAGRTGQSWGKKALNLRLVGEETGQPIGAGMAFVRDLAHIVDGVICYIGFLFPLWDAKRQTLADKMVKTVVVSA